MSKRGKSTRVRDQDNPLKRNNFKPTESDNASYRGSTANTASTNKRKRTVIG